MLFLFFFGGPQIGIDFGPIGSTIIAFSLVGIAFDYQLFRAYCFRSPSPVRGRAGWGLSKQLIFLKIIIPQMLPNCPQGLITYAIGTVKRMSIASAVSVSEILFVAKQGIAANKRALHLSGHHGCSLYPDRHAASGVQRAQSKAMWRHEYPSRSRISGPYPARPRHDLLISPIVIVVSNLLALPLAIYMLQPKARYAASWSATAFSPAQCRCLPSCLAPYIRPAPLRHLSEPVPSALIGLIFASAAYKYGIPALRFRNIPKGQFDAARALGLKTFPLYFKVIIPQAYRIAAPSLFSNAIQMVKGSSLASLVTVDELTAGLHHNHLRHITRRSRFCPW